MAFRQQKILGLALGDGSILAAEVHLRGRKRTIHRTGEFPLDESNLHDSVQLGKELAAFLRSTGITAKDAVIGLSADWLVLKEFRVPQAGPEALPNILRLQAEQEFSFDPKDLIVDCDFNPTTSDSQTVLLVASLRQRVGQLQALVQAAGLKTLAVTPTAMALANATPSKDPATGLTVYLRPACAEIALHEGGRVRQVRAVPLSAGGDMPVAEYRAQTIASEIRRLLLKMPDSKSAPFELALWNGIEDSSPLPAELESLLPVSVLAAQDMAALGLGSTGRDEEENIRFAPAAAVALAGAAHPSIDFLHSRLATVEKSSRGRQVAWAAILILAVGASIAAGWKEWSEKTDVVAHLTDNIENMRDGVTKADRFNQKVLAASSWFEHRPGYLACMREVTLAFPKEGRIWANRLSVRDDMRVLVSGKTEDEREVLEVLDQLKKSKTVRNAKLLHVREESGKARTVSFALSFQYGSEE